MSVKVGGTPVEFIIDSGSPINAITIDDWNRLKKAGAERFNEKRRCEREFHGYAASKPLSIEASFKARIEIDKFKPSTTAEVFVVRDAKHALLSYQTSTALKILKIGLDVNTIQAELAKPFPKFPGVLVKLQVDPSIVPKQLAYYRVPAAVEELVEQKLDEMLQKDIIEKVNGPSTWISPMLVIPKGKSDIRICVDMREPNKAIKREHHPMPIIETFLNKLRGARYFSRLDIQSAYHHVELAEESRELTTFLTTRGLLRYKRLMFGLNAAPEIFQKVMESMLEGLDGVIVFIDDIGVIGKTKEEHDRNLHALLTRLKQNHATLNMDKCRMNMTEMEILGFKVDKDGIRAAESKIAAIQKFRKPESAAEVRSFLGLIQFVGHFIPNLASRTEPLRKMIRGEVQSFGQEQQKAFDDLRSDLIKNVRRLGYFDPKDETEVYVDASPWAIGAALVQQKDNKRRIIAFVSKSLTETERRYPQTQREALAVVWAVERLYFYLFGLKFTLFTDHKTLEYIFMGKHQNGKRACTRAESWALRLQPYDFVVKYIPGHLNIADPLSRLYQSKDEQFGESSEHFLCPIEETLPALSLSKITIETQKDPELQLVKQALDDDVWPKEITRFEAFKNELGVIKDVVVREDRIILPKSLRDLAMNIAHKGHPGEVMMKRILRERTWWPGLDKDVKEHLKQCLGCTVTAPEERPEPMCRKKLPERAWQEVAVDFLEVPECKTTFLVLVDYYSRYLVVKPMTSTTAECTIKKLEEIFETWSHPESMTADNGPPFNSEVFARFCENKAISLINTIPYWPRMNGEVERQNRGAVRALKIGKVEKRTWTKAMPEYVYSYNIRPHTVTNKAPLELMTGRPVKDLLPMRMSQQNLEDEELRERDATAKARGKEDADKRLHAKPSDVKAGDVVFAKNHAKGKLEPRFAPVPFRVLKRTGNEAIIQSGDGVKYRRCVTHLKRWLKNDDKKENLKQNSDETQTQHELEKDTPAKRPRREVQKPMRYQ